MRVFIHSTTDTCENFTGFLTFDFNADVPENIQCRQMDFKKFIIGEHV